MALKPETPDQYVDTLPEDRKEAFQKLRKILTENLPEGYVEEISYGMIGYVIPFSIYPDGYSVKPKVPLPLINLGNTKGHIALHHMGVYSVPDLAEWFQEEYSKHSKAKLDMGKGCIRFKKVDDIPYELLGQLARKIDVQTWIKTYETAIRRPKK